MSNWIELGRGNASVVFDLTMNSPHRTFLFTDIEGSYRLWEGHPEAMPRALAVHDAVLLRAVTANNGRIFKTVGDAVCAVFELPIDGVRAAVAAQRELQGTDWAAVGLSRPLTVRMALQAGEVQERDGDFAGLVLNRISRLLRAGHGGQVLLSGSVAAELERSPMGGVGLRDLGERRLRDVPGAHRIYQLEIDGLRATFPPLETLDVIAHNLPVALNACLDRESEQAEILRLLLDSPARLVTLLGPGGIGKTRLALHVASQLIDAFSGGVWFVDLSGVRDAELIPASVASALGVRIEPGCDPVATIAAQARELRRLLILDNCEQIVDGVATFVSAVLPLTSGLRVMATSRVPLHIRGEQRVEIGPLPVEADALAGPAVQLFLERAQQLRPAFELTDANRDSIFEICHRVDGIPLALELAAARVAVLSPEALRIRLSSRLSVLTSTNRDLPERHQTLRAAIAWSYTLLNEDEQRAFRALSVFQGGWSFAAAQAVLGMDELATMDVLASLRDKSLVRLTETDDGDPRYSMLETIQEFGWEQVTVADEKRIVCSAHVAFFVDLTAEAANHIEGGPLQRQWLRQLDREIANIRAALQWSHSAGLVEEALDLCMNFWFYWSQRGLAPEGQAWFERVLELAAEAEPALRGGALRRLANLSVERGELRTAEALYRASSELERSAANPPGLAASLIGLGMVSGMLGRSEDEYSIQSEALAIGRQIGDTRSVAISLFNLAYCARNRGDHAEALRVLDQVLELQLELQDDIGIAFNQTLAARARLDAGELDIAALLLDSAEQVFIANDVSDGLALARMTQAALSFEQGDVARAGSLIEEAVVSCRERGDKGNLAEALEIQAAILAQDGQLEASAALLGEACYLRERSGAVKPPIDADRLEDVQRSIAVCLGERVAAFHRERGRQHGARANWVNASPLNALMFIGDAVAG